MEKQEYFTMHRLEKKHWWFFGKRKIFLHFWNKFIEGKKSQDIKILDVGCGDGSYIANLNKLGYQNTFGVDFADEAINFCHQSRIKNITWTDLEKGIPFEDNCFEAIIILDVLEHIKNEDRIISEIRRVLRPGGLCFINVPAYQFLWSYHDKYLHHQRRYSRGYLLRKAREYNFKVKKFTYTNAFILPPAVIVRLLKKNVKEGSSDTKEANFLVNSLLKFVYLVEVFLLSLFSFPAGLSIFMIVEK